MLTTGSDGILIEKWQPDTDLQGSKADKIGD